MAVFLETIGFPVPAAIALVIAGGASATGSLSIPIALATAFAAMLAGDTLMYLLGRRTGWWLLGVLCKLSLNPDSCILRSADLFFRKGRILLVFAKFVPGINTIAPPLAGSMNMPFVQFFRLDLAGASLYVGSYFLLGFLFSGAVGAIIGTYQVMGRAATLALIGLVAVYAGSQVWLWSRGRSKSVVFVQPAEAAHRLSEGDGVIYDVRSHGYYDPKATRIQGSRRLDPNALPQLEGSLPRDRTLYLYCTCRGEATSARVAEALRHKGVKSSVIRGGLRAWKKAGLPIEPVPAEELETLPVFD
jgi:membrane protein DedA with SNARE-associated domain/rhodanese-related sulfurtransferase